MSEDWISLGNHPLSEPTCFENKEWANKYSGKVLTAWLNQLRRTFPCLPARIVIKQSQEEFFVVVTFTDERQFEYAKDIADELPYCWDDKAKEELGSLYFKETKELYCLKEKDRK